MDSQNNDHSFLKKHGILFNQDGYLHNSKSEENKKILHLQQDPWGHINPEHSGTKRKVLSQDPQTGEKRPGKQGLHGEIYQLKLLMLFLKRGVTNRYSFRLSTEKQEAKKFDDLFFEITNNGKKEYRLLQAKHKDDESKKIKFDNLLTESDGDYSLVKYFFSYQDSKKEKLFKKGVIKDVTVCTNIDLDLEDSYELNGISKTIRDLVHEIETRDCILDANSNISNKKSVRYGFSKKIALLLKPKLEDYNLTRLAKRLAECLLKNNSIQHHQASDIFEIYHTVLALEVIDVKTKKFHDAFIKNDGLSEDAKKFRKVFEEEIRKQAKHALSLETINSAISDKKLIDNKPIGLKLSKHFGVGNDKTWPKDAISDDHIKDFLDHLVFAVNQPNEQQLGELIESDISKEFNFAATSYVYSELLVKMLDWLNGKGKEFISFQDGNSLFEEMQQKISELELTGLIVEYRSKVKKYGINFRSDAIQEMGLNDIFASENVKTHIFNIITENSLLCAIKVVQVLTNMYSDTEKYIFLKLDSVLYLQDRVVHAFEGNKDVLVIECETVESKEDIQVLFNHLSKIIRSTNNKKIIIITQKDDSLAKMFKDKMAEKYQEKIDKRNSLTDLTDNSQNILLQEGKIKFQGRELNLGTLINNQLKDLINTEILSKIVNGDEIKIGEELANLDDIDDFYIERIFNRQTKVLKNFEKENSKLYVIHTSQIDIQNLGKDQDIVIISDTSEHFNKLCDEYKNHNINIHWLKKQNNEYVWQSSYNKLSNLRNFIDTRDISVAEYQTNNIIRATDKILIISAEPGMGKSTVLTKLAQNKKELNPSLWITRINLNDCTSKLEKANFGGNIDQAVNFLLDAAHLERTLEKEIFKSRIFDQGKISLLFDGFDEISPTYKDKVTDLLKILKNTKVETIWVTTRPHMRNTLEDQLSTLSYTLKQLTRKEQELFLKNFWGKKPNRDIENDRLNMYVEELLNLLGRYIADKEAEFTGIPLQTRMLAEAFQRDFKNFFYSNQNLSNLPKMLDLVDLYQKFIYTKYYDIYCKEKKKQDLTSTYNQEDNAELYQIFLEKHQKAALYTLLGQDMSKILLKNEDLRPFMAKVRDGKEKTGIIIQFANDKFTFAHRTFAEYLTADWLAHNKEVKEVKDVLHATIFKPENDVLRGFFDRMMIKDKSDENNYKLHVAVLNEDENSISRLLAEKQRAQNIIDVPDKGGRTPLHLAAAYGYLNMIKILLDNGANINVKDKIFDWKPISFADKGGYWAITELFLQNGASGDEMFEAIKQGDTERKETLLHLAAREGYIKFTEILIQKGANINAQDKDGKTPLHWAAENGQLSIAKLLVSKGADVNVNSSIGPPFRRRHKKWTPLHYAALKNHIEVIKLLLDNNAKFIRDSGGATPLDVTDNKYTIKILGGGYPMESILANDDLDSFKKTNRENFSNLYGWGIMHIAARKGSLKIIEYMLRNGAKVDGVGPCSTPLTVAAVNGRLNVVKILMDNGANMYPDTDIDGWSPLLGASRASRSFEDEKDLKESDYLEIVKYFIEQKHANIEITDKKGTTPLQTAAHHNRLEIVKYLVEKGANINAVDKLGAPIALSAAYNNNPQVVKFLLEKGAMMYSGQGIAGKLEMTVLHFAAFYDSLEIVKLLVEGKKVEVNAGRDASLTPLHMAALSNSEKTIEYLIEQGGDVDVSVNLDNILKILTEEKETFKDTSYYVCVSRTSKVLQWLREPRSRPLSGMIGLTPHIMSKLIGYNNELLKNSSRGGLANKIREAPILTTIY